MSLKLKFNLVFMLLFVIALGVAGGSIYRLVYDNANAEVVHDAQRMMDVAVAVRDYTSVEIKPHLDPLLVREFLPQTVPAFAATETLKRLESRQPGFSYKEATLNPTNLRDQATPWERDIVESFRKSPELTELQGHVNTIQGERFYVARPIQIKSPSCLTCHSTPEVAPASMKAKYGTTYGFGWKLNEIVGAQVVAVPTEIPKKKAERVFVTFMVSLTLVFLTVFVALNWLLQRLVIRPVREVADAAQRVSKGDMSLAEFAENRRDEIGTLHRSFNRMRRSVVKAMEMLGR